MLLSEMSGLIRKCKGAVLLEFALFVGLIVLCGSGIIGFGFDMWEYSSLVESSRIATRTAAGYRGNDTICNVTKRAFEKSMSDSGFDPARYQKSLSQIDLQTGITGNYRDVGTNGATISFTGPFRVTSRNKLTGLQFTVSRPALDRLGSLRAILFPIFYSSTFMLESDATVDQTCL